MTALPMQALAWRKMQGCAAVKLHARAPSLTSRPWRLWSDAGFVSVELSRTTMQISFYSIVQEDAIYSISLHPL